MPLPGPPQPPDAHARTGLWQQKKKCYAPIPHTQTSPDGTFSCLTIDPDYKAKWKTAFAKMQPLIQAGALIGVFLGDEHMWFGVKVSEVKLIADLIRSDWPVSNPIPSEPRICSHLFSVCWLLFRDTLPSRSQPHAWLWAVFPPCYILKMSQHSRAGHRRRSSTRTRRRT